MRPFLFLMLTVLVAGPLMGSGCTQIEYKLWEAIGYEKRDLLERNIDKTKDDQEEVSEQFQSVIDKIRSEYDFEGGELEKIYDDLSGEYKQAEDKASRLKNRVEKVQQVAADLFQEWEAELSEISDPKLRRDSAQKRKQTMQKFQQMSGAMDKVVASLDPVMVKLNDRVLWLKHNLNAMALKSFRKEFRNIEIEVGQLQRQMEAASREAEQFMSKIDSV